MQEESISTQEVVMEGILILNPLRVHQHYEVTTIGENKNKNGNRNPEIVRETQITGKKARKLSKKKAKLEKLQGATKKTSEEIGLQNLNLAGTPGPRRMGLRLGKAI
jgi:hypothetical protein